MMRFPNRTYQGCPHIFRFYYKRARLQTLRVKLWILLFAIISIHAISVPCQYAKYVDTKLTGFVLFSGR